jgi:uncharacterized protein
MINRRRFLQTLAALAASPAQATVSGRATGFGKLVADRSRIIDLPEGFKYRVIARMGDEMSDGLLVPGNADGMAAFAGENGRINLVCNHENVPAQQYKGPFGDDLERLHLLRPACLYDHGGGSTPGSGGTTTIVYNPATGTGERQFLSLAGTEMNCAGGATPWGSWLSCEETFSKPGRRIESARQVRRSKRHGYVFEVPALAARCIEPQPLTAMGRFEHEAAAVDPVSGVVYLTEDRYRSLLYRFLPDVPGELHRGGRLQALAVHSRAGFDTRNWSSDSLLPLDQWLEVRWIELQDVDSNKNDLRLRGYHQGAARFARGEGLCFADGSIFFSCTIGGPDRLGQIFEYRLSPFEGTDRETTQRGQFRLVAESTRASILRNADNLIMSPWGDLIICEDTAGHSGLIGLRPDGTQYYLADNAYTASEFAGVCFSPDGKTMFLNIQVQGLTLAINGPWPGSVR